MCHLEDTVIHSISEISVRLTERALEIFSYLKFSSIGLNLFYPYQL